MQDALGKGTHLVISSVISRGDFRQRSYDKRRDLIQILLRSHTDIDEEYDVVFYGCDKLNEMGLHLVSL